MRKEYMGLVDQKINRKFLLLLPVFFILFCPFTGCKKFDSPYKDNTPNNNEINATVVSPTSTITINAKGSKTRLGCTFGGRIIEGTDDTNASIAINLLNASIECFNSPGTYTFHATYWKDIKSYFSSNNNNSSNRYETNINNRGRITFTVLNDHYMEGYFNTVCHCISQVCDADSVIVTGTFKGDYFK